MSRKHFPQRGDKVNDSRRTPHANGFVLRVIFDDGPDEVIVRFDNGIHNYDYHEFEYTWTDRYGGVFILAEEKFAVSPSIQPSEQNND
jgi:hypothetical protein